MSSDQIHILVILTATVAMFLWGRWRHDMVAAGALLMPVAVQMARRLELPPGQVLMPLAFGTILGGMTTMIGTPPNLIVSGFRAQNGGRGFGMFDFTPVGLTVAIGASCAFLTPIGHQNNTLILGPGGFRFGDYWKLGLPLQILVIAIGVPMLLVVWPW